MSKFIRVEDLEKLEKDFELDKTTMNIIYIQSSQIDPAEIAEGLKNDPWCCCECYRKALTDFLAALEGK